MDSTIQACFGKLDSKDANEQYVAMNQILDAIGDPELKDLALSLIDEEQDPKYKKKYSRLWKNI